MKVQIFLFCAVFATVSCVRADCVLKNSRHDDYGVVRLGAKWGSVPSVWHKLAKCDDDGACNFIDGNGTRYFVEDNLIVRKEIEVRNGKNLPLSLAPQDNVLSFIKKVGGVSGEVVFSVGYRGGKYSITTGRCLVNSLREPFSFFAIFDERGKLQMVGTRADTTTD